ncbi:MAG: phenylalanine--tRNA ligase subunit alpha [Chloroflexi bacterium]|nr:phenylalanine--tRNA ligase subunit alpha [Chloroflexota bacterium]
MHDELQRLQTDALASLTAAAAAGALEAWRVRFLGRKGALTDAMKLLGTLSREERPAYGAAANEVKTALEMAFAERQEALKAAALAAELTGGAVDVTLPGRPPALGHLHVTTQNLRQLYAVFALMGFEVYDAPDVETDDYNFGLLNIPPYHPARDMWDTFWVSQVGAGLDARLGADDDQTKKPARTGAGLSDAVTAADRAGVGAGLSDAVTAADRVTRPAPTLVMRTHTSPGQIRAMRERCPEPIRVVLPGKCYRYEQITARAEHQFYQMEGLAVGKGIRLTDLIGTLKQFARVMYGANRVLRVRGSYFPFTEPSIEADMDCILCGGKGCGVCKYTGWLEIAGAGMVHPIVLRNGGYDPDVYSGFAFGMGVERPSMLKHNINDIRYFYGNDLRFLGQF